MRFYCSDRATRETKGDPCLVTEWSFIHFLSGFAFSVPILFIFYFVYVKYKSVQLDRIKLYTFLLFSLLHLIYEVKDVYCTYGKNGKGTENQIWLCKFGEGDNTWENSIFDQIISMIGAAIFLFLVTLPPSWWLWLLVVFYVVSMVLFIRNPEMV